MESPFTARFQYRGCPVLRVLAFCLLLSNVAVAQSALRKKIPDKLVVLTFDDGVKSDYTNIAPVLKKYGFGATFFVCEFPPDFSDTTKYMTWNQIKTLSDEGFEIGNHTWHHVGISGISKDSLRAELLYINRKCDSLHIPRPINFAYPGYVTDSSKIAVLADLGYVTARVGGDRAYVPGKDNPYLIPSFTPVDTLQKAIQAIEQAKDGAVVILTIHGVPDIAHPWVNTSLEVFNAYMAYLFDHHYTVISMRELGKYVTY
jgi:peptidoglycan/xylan/chitin deacetylase (PgdA/CDA1 family)